jgi:hypothetical protein
MSDIKGLREISSDPFGKFLTALSKKFSAFLAKDQAELVENPEDIYGDGQDVESALKYHNFVMSKKFPVSPTNVTYYSPVEPDKDKVRLYLGAVWPNLGTEMTDKSGYGNSAIIHGDPVLIDGAPFDLGIVDATNATKSIAVKFNRPNSESENTDHLTIPDCVDLFIPSSGGISYFIRFRVHNLEQEGDCPRTIFEKVDDSTPNNGAKLEVSPTGRLIFQLKRAGTEYNKQTAEETIEVDTVYEVWLTYAVSGNVTHVYINGVDKTLTTASPPTWHTTLQNHDISIFTCGEGTDAGFVYGDFYHMMIKMEVVSQSQVTNHFTNKWTTASIPFGQVAISNYSATTGISLDRISKQMSLKYNVISNLTRISKSMTYKWNVLSSGPSSLVSFSSLSFSPSFTISLTRVSKSMTYKWNVVVSAPSSTSFTSASFTSASYTTS